MQEVSSMLLEKILAAGIGDRPVVFVTHRYAQCFLCGQQVDNYCCFWVSQHNYLLKFLWIDFVESSQVLTDTTLFCCNNISYPLFCSMGGLVVKQILSKAKSENINNLVNNTKGIVCLSNRYFTYNVVLLDLYYHLYELWCPAVISGFL